MKLKKIHLIGGILGLLILASSFLFYSNINLLIFLVALSFAISAAPFVLELLAESRRESEINDMFLEFSRNLSESVRAGTPVSKSILNLSGRNYGALTVHVQKLANQISIGIPVNKSLETFAYEVDNKVISRAITLIREAEKAGGEIEAILESSARSIAEIEKLRKERRSAISSLVAQGYIIFFIFIAIMLVMEFKILPITESLSNVNFDLNSLGSVEQMQGTTPAVSLADTTSKCPGGYVSPFLGLLLIQGLFAGIIIGKISEGFLKAGIRHSAILMFSAALIAQGARVIFC